MAASVHRGPVGHSKGQRKIDGGTLCKQPSPLHGPVGREVDHWHSPITDSVSEFGSYFSRQSKSLLIALLDLVPIKPDSPYSTALLRHYVEGSGDPYYLKEIPKDWQEWILKTTGGRLGFHKELDPYNSGLYDLRNSLGHFNVVIEMNKDKTKIYSIQDTYTFGFKKNDKAQRGRHGFPLGQIDDFTVNLMRKLLPSQKYCNPGGFEEQWEIKKIGKETVLFIPQQFLVEQGKDFSIKGSFVR